MAGKVAFVFPGQGSQHTGMAGALAMEIDARRADLAAGAVAADGRFHDVETRLDLTGRPRFVVARRKEQ